MLIGRVTEGLVLHPDNEHIMYPLGTTIVLRHIISRTQNFLRGHDNDISVITVSNSGKYIASGQKTHSGFQVSNFAALPSVMASRFSTKNGNTRKRYCAHRDSNTDSLLVG